MSDKIEIILTVGGGNGERVLEINPMDYKPGTKHTLTPQNVLAGGSSVNHSCRLLATGNLVFPILPIVEDGVGRIVYNTLYNAKETGRVVYDFNDIYMNDNGLATPFTTIVTVGAQRTIFTEFSENLINAYFPHYDKRIETLFQFEKEKKVTLKAVMIGHIHADREGSPGQAGGISQSIIDHFYVNKVPIFTNFGGSQYKLGLNRWERFLRKIDCFQLDIYEMREFCKDRLNSLNLEDIFNFFKDKCTVIVTLERMGAVARLKNSDNVRFAWPYDLQPENIKDTTGAGDAFASGVVAKMIDTPFENDDLLGEALDNGRLWGAYACTTKGGANECPSLAELENFQNNHPLFKNSEIKTIEEARPMLKVFDRIFL